MIIKNELFTERSVLHVKISVVIVNWNYHTAHTHNVLQVHKSLKCFQILLKKKEKTQRISCRKQCLPLLEHWLKSKLTEVKTHHLLIGWWRQVILFLMGTWYHKPSKSEAAIVTMQMRLNFMLEFSLPMLCLHTAPPLEPCCWLKSLQCFSTEFQGISQAKLIIVMIRKQMHLPWCIRSRKSTPQEITLCRTTLVNCWYARIWRYTRHLPARLALRTRFSSFL